MKLFSYARMAALIAIAAVFVVAGIPPKANPPEAPAAPTAPAVSKTNTAVPTVYPSYGHAIAINGIHNLTDALYYYPNLDPTTAKIVKTDRTIIAHVSYLQDGKVYWTKKLHTYPTGTEVITDGKIVILTRCGNQLTYQPPTDYVVLPNEPLDLDTPVEVPEDNFDVPLAPQPPVETTAIPSPDVHTAIGTPTSFIPFVPAVSVGTPSATKSIGFIPPTAIPPTTPVSVSEPGTGAMLVVGCLFYILFSIRQRYF